MALKVNNRIYNQRKNELEANAGRAGLGLYDLQYVIILAAAF